MNDKIAFQNCKRFENIAWLKVNYITQIVSNKFNELAFSLIDNSMENIVNTRS